MDRKLCYPSIEFPNVLSETWNNLMVFIVFINS